MDVTISSPVYLADGRIDCFIDFGDGRGELPFTASDNDPEQFVRDIFDAAVALGPDPYVPPPPPDPAVELAAWRASVSISKAAFCIAARGAGILNDTDAVAAARGDWPASMAGALAGLTADQLIEAKITWAAATTIERANPLVQMVAAFLALTPEQLDALFGA